jgi:hypothetical protein
MIGAENHLELVLKDGTTSKMKTLRLDESTSDQIFKRTGDVVRITVHIDESILK